MCMDLFASHFISQNEWVEVILSTNMYHLETKCWPFLDSVVLLNM